jgi:hypothetical protein
VRHNFSNNATVQRRAATRSSKWSIASGASPPVGLRKSFRSLAGRRLLRRNAAKTKNRGATDDAVILRLGT